MAKKSSKTEAVQEQFPATDTKVEAGTTADTTPAPAEIKTETPAPDATKEQIKNTVKDLFTKVAKRDDLQIQIDELNKELAEYGLAGTVATAPAPESRVVVPRQTFPELNMESFTAFLKEAKGSGQKTADIIAKFGLGNWTKFKKANENKLRFVPDTAKKTIKIWFLK